MKTFYQPFSFLIENINETQQVLKIYSNEYEKIEEINEYLKQKTVELDKNNKRLLNKYNKIKNEVNSFKNFDNFQNLFQQNEKLKENSKNLNKFLNETQKKTVF